MARTARASEESRTRGAGPSESPLTLAQSVRPRLMRGVRLRRDERRGGHVLLAPERVVRADPVAVAVLERCDGSRTLGEIVDDLCVVYKGERSRIDADVRALIADMIDRKMVAL
jgi:pyrroloquinoline quinone biosynthesis protein D